MAGIWEHLLTFKVEKAATLIDSDNYCSKYVGKTFLVVLRNDETSVPPDVGETFVVEYQYSEDRIGHELETRYKLVDLTGWATLD